mmetsp:Transcript_17697/g.30047  ORF Transcript_17697/g.30047 Transcript_17697/m.30047 type:complete len:87 (-) Transcript_17697:7627-7887(-)
MLRVLYHHRPQSTLLRFLLLSSQSAIITDSQTEPDTDSSGYIAICFKVRNKKTCAKYNQYRASACGGNGASPEATVTTESRSTLYC